MRKKVYLVVIQEKYVRDMQVFAPEICPKGQWSKLQEEDIYLSSELEREWKDWSGRIFLCQIAAESNELEKKVKEIAEKYKVPTEILEMIPVQENRNSCKAAHILGRAGDREELVEELGEEGYVGRFYDFLQGKFHPGSIQSKDMPVLSPDQAWHVIYCMQEHFGLFRDDFERCKDCGCIYDSHNGGAVISEETEPVIIRDMLGEVYTHTFKEEEYGTYCEECRPD